MTGNLTLLERTESGRREQHHMRARKLRFKLVDASPITINLLLLTNLSFLLGLYVNS